MDIITPEQAIEGAKGLTFEKVWAAFMESRMESRMEMQELRRSISEVSKNVGGISNTLGKLTESMFATELCRKFDEYGFTFTKSGQRTTFSKNKKVVTEADFFLENGEYAMPVEVKTELKDADIDHHLKRIAIIRQYFDERNDNRKLVGAVAGEIVSEAVAERAHSEGFFVLAPSGDSVVIAAAPDGFTAREW